MAVFRILSGVLICLLGFYISLIGTSRSLTDSERASVDRAISILEERGFEQDAWLLRNVTAFRGPDNWINRVSTQTEKDLAFAKTNFPFQIVTIYPEFATIPLDDVERAAILLHEARHLQGESESAAYRYVWDNHCKLGWTYTRYFSGPSFDNTMLEARKLNPGLGVDPCPN